VKTLLLGLGNELYGDDGVGICVARRLKEEVRMKKRDAPQMPDVEIEECSLSGLALLDVIVGYDRLILVDTIKKEAPVLGRVRLLRENQIRAIPGPSPHYVSVPQTIEIGRKLGLHVPSEILIIAIEDKNIHTLGEGLSKEMSRRLPSIVRRVKKVLLSE